MNRVVVPKNLKGKPLFNFMVKNKAAILGTKKAGIKYSDSLVSAPSVTVKRKAGSVNKAGTLSIDDMEDGVVHVKVSCNAAWWCDEAMDVLTDKCYDKSIAEKGTLIPHIADHIHLSTNHVGDVTAVYTQKVPLKDLGIDAAGNTTCAIMETDVREDYNEQTYKFYKNGKINQHSIGLIYVSIGMCINDKDYLPEYELWNKYYDKVINKAEVDECGYFFIVPEIKWIENSCVLFACNELTPTLEITDTDTAAKSTDASPSINKSMVLCPNCEKRFNADDSTNCPGCGQYVSLNSTAIEHSTFDAIKAIQQTTFIKL